VGDSGVREDRGRGAVAAELHAFGGERRPKARQQAAGGRRMDQELLGRVADAGPLDLGVEQDRLGHSGVGVPVDIDAADAREVLDHGNRAVFGDKADEALPSAGDDAVDKRVQPEECRECGAVGRRDDLDRIQNRPSALGIRNPRKRRAGDRLPDEAGERRIRMKCLPAASQDRGIPGLQAQHGAVHGDVGARLVDDADHAYRHPNLSDDKAVGPRPFGEGIADRIRKGRHLEDRRRQPFQPVGAQGQAVDLGPGQAVARGLVEIPPVGGQQAVVRGVDQAGEPPQGVVFGLRRGRREDKGGGTRPLGKPGDELCEVGGHETATKPRIRARRKRC